MKRDTRTAQDYYRYLQCPHWPYWERFGDPVDRRELSAAEDKRQQDGLQHEKKIVNTWLGDVDEVTVHSPEQGMQATLDLMRRGAPYIYQGWLVVGDCSGRPDILERVPGKSILGDWMYIPVDIKRGHDWKKEYKAQLTFYATLLEAIQGVFPAHADIINADGERLMFAPEEFLAEFREMTEAIERIRGGEIPDPVYRKSCVDVSPWGKACFRLAQERDDIALIFNVDVRKLKLLRSFGIRTVDDATHLSVTELAGRAPGLTERALEAVKRQARSLKKNSVIIRDPFHNPTQGMEIHFDIESYPEEDVDYLYGLLTVDPKTGEKAYKSFVAREPAEEKIMWRAFLAWIETLPSEYTVYHYAAYESSRLTTLAKRYGDEENPWLKRFQERLVDLKDLTRESAVFPLYFYSLKTIGKFLGYAWTGDVSNGGDSVTAYESWLATHDESILNSIVAYNEHDVRATAHLLEWLTRYAAATTTYEQPYPWK